MSRKQLNEKYKTDNVDDIIKGLEMEVTIIKKNNENKDTSINEKIKKIIVNKTIKKNNIIKKTNVVEQTNKMIIKKYENNVKSIIKVQSFIRKYLQQNKKVLLPLQERHITSIPILFSWCITSIGEFPSPILFPSILFATICSIKPSSNI